MSNMSEGEMTWSGRILLSTTKNIQPWGVLQGSH